MDKLENQPCPVCHKKTLVLTEEEMDIPYFGKTYLFSMSCNNCKYSKSDVEAEERKEPCRITFTIEKETDMKVRVVKSSEATIKIPQLRMSVESGP
ncbi:MAG: ZPR1 zinc finger domain-containing protein, partial [archaeon]